MSKDQGEVIHLQTVSPDQLLPDEVVFDPDRYRPESAVFNKEEPSRTFAIARERLSNILQGPLLKAPLLMQTKRALAAVWRVAPGHITVVLGQRRGNELTLENVLTVLSEKEYQQSTILLDLVPSDLPSWSR